MKLTEKIKNAKDDELLYIGAKNGSSFMFIGTKGEFLKAESLINKRNNLRERDVAEEYAHTVDIPGRTLLLNGTGMGKYWLRSELLSDNEMRKAIGLESDK